MCEKDLGIEEVDLSFENMTFELQEEVDEDLGDLYLAGSEDEYRKEELEKQATPLIQEKVNEAMASQVTRLKREAAELIMEKDNATIEAIKAEHKKLEKKRARRKLLNTIKSGLLAIIFFGGIFVVCTNNQIKPLVKTVFGGLAEFVSDVINDEETSSNELIESIGKALNDANTRVVYVEE